MIGVWFKKGKVFLSLTFTLIPQILIDYHATPISRHFRFRKTLARIKQDFSWPNMHRTVEEFLQQYEKCQRFKTDCMKPTRLLQPLPVPIQVWTDISMDFIKGLPSSHGYNCIMVVVDRLSKYACLIPLKHPYTTIIVAKAFISNIVRLYGIPTSIVSDCDKVYISTFLANIISVSRHPAMYEL